MNSNETDFETVAIFDNSFEPQLIVAKSMLEEAGITYVVVNENARSFKPMPFTTPLPISIELRVDIARKQEALEILESIENG